MSEFDELYQEVILEHYRSPRGAARLDSVPETARLENPLCGDSIKVEAVQGPEGTLKVRFEAAGCAISIASASLMTEALEGLGAEEARSISAAFIRAMRGEGGLDLDAMGDLAALKGVCGYPARVKCATLAWHALMEALRARDP